MTDTLRDILLKPIADNAATRRYQALLDDYVDRLTKHWDPARGLLGSTGTALPHESVPAFWNLDEDERRSLCDEPAREVYARAAGRDGTAPLCIAAFCRYSPLSRHRNNPELLRFFEAGLRFHVDAIRDDGLMASCGLNGECWAHGWDVEGLIYGMVLCGDALDAALRARAMDRFQLSANRHAAAEAVPAVIGSYGNQRCVWILGLYLYGRLLERPDLIALADRHWEDTMPKVLDASGQVIEQYGPCMHYSYTAFIYAWLNLAVRGDASEAKRVLNCLRWFVQRHTESLYPIAGPSTRSYKETAADHIIDLLPAAEQLRRLDPSIRDFVARGLAKAATPKQALDAAPELLRGLKAGAGHGTSPLIWAMLTADDGAAAPAPPRVRVTEFHKSTHLLKRAPLQYVLVRRDYQTHINFCDFLPFSGIQTWALHDEPPIVHPTPLAPSTTQGDRLDTARQGASHNWGLYGAGALGIDAYANNPQGDDALWLFVARYDWLWRVTVLTDRSTVVLEFGGGPRRTFWTLNRVEPAEPELGEGVVRFRGRQACLHAADAGVPDLVDLSGVEDEWARGVRQLRYRCGNQPAAFALSDASFTFAGPLPAGPEPWRFADAAGEYEVQLDPRLFVPNPGNFRVDTFQLAHGSTARVA